MYKKRVLKVVTFQVILTISVIAFLFVLFITLQNLKNDKDASIFAAKEDINKLSQVISSSIEMSFVSVDQTLQRATERQYFNMLFGKTLSSDMEHNLSMWVNKTPHIDAIFFTNESGIVDVFFKKGEKQFKVRPGYKFSSENHFIEHKDNPNVDLLISTSNGKSNNRIFVSRRIENINGSFGGLAVAVIDGNYIINVLNSIERGSKTQMSIMLGENQLIVRADGLADGSNIFKMINGDVTANPDGSVMVVGKYLNDEFMILSKQKLNNLPISVSLAMGEVDIFSGWYEKRNNYFILAGILGLFFLTIIFFIFLLGQKMSFAKFSEKKALLASQAKTEFLAKMSHELRTPLNAIIGFSDMLSTGYFGKVTAEQVERLKDINMCGNHLLEFINEILDFSKADAGKLKLKEDLVDLHEVVSKAIRIIEQKAKSGGIKVVNKVPRDVNSILADRRKVKQMMINLLSNAVKFTKEGGVVTVSCDFDDDGNFIINVVDTGVGMKSKDIPKAMGIFEQINTSDDESGTGLGLPLCKMFTEMHDGEFKLESEVGVGTHASIIIPAERIGKPMFDEQLSGVANRA